MLSDRGWNLTLKGKAGLHGRRESTTLPPSGPRESNHLPERGIEELGLVWRRGSFDAFDVECPQQHGERINCDFLREIFPRADPM
jgi:hypothetical protein